MKSKKLLISLAVVAVFIVFIIIMSSVFSVKQVAPVYHRFDGQQSIGTEDAPTINDILQLSKGKSIFTLSKAKLLEELNQKYPTWHAFAVVKNFPNILEVHFVKRVAVAKIDIGGNVVYIDSYGYVIQAPEEGNHLDITSAFSHRDATNVSVGSPLTFSDAINNVRLKQILQALIATWQCNLEFEDLPQILGESNVFTFNAGGDMIIKTRLGAQIIIMGATGEQGYSDRLVNGIINAYSVYYTGSAEVQKEGSVIRVDKNGNVTTNKVN